jgi:hypothetical protein
LALAALDRVGGGTAMASPSYGIDVVALAFAVVLAATIVLLISHDLMPPPLSGAH